MASYELVFIAQPELDEEGLAALLDKFTNMVQGLGAQVAQIEARGKRQLAYPIRKYREGYYYVVQLEAGPDVPASLNRALRLDEQIIRHLIVAKDEGE